MRLRPFLMLLAALLIQHPSFAGTEDAEKRLKSATDEVVTLAKGASDNASMVEASRPVMQKYLSFETMTRRAVGPGWRQFTPDQQKQATQLFTTLILRTYCKKLNPGEDPVIKFKPASNPASNRVDIPTTITYKGSNYEVIYRMEQIDGWRVTDVVIEGVSLIANYRSQFDVQFKSGGSTAVMESLTQSVARPK